MIVMQYADNGSLLSYLDQNINKLTWRRKSHHLRNIACYLNTIHHSGLVHCDLHGGNIVLHSIVRRIQFFGGDDDGDDYDTCPFICDFGLSQSVNSRQQNSTIRGVLPFIAPEVFHTCKFTRKSDIYIFWYYYDCYW